MFLIPLLLDHLVISNFYTAIENDVMEALISYIKVLEEDFFLSLKAFLIIIS